MKYDPHKIEAKWRERWPKERSSFELKPGDEPYYCLDMISYPSSEGLHMGHWRPYTIADTWARYQTMRGKKVLHPVGFDAFGLPAENAAIKSGTHPAVYTEKSITNFTRQIQEMGKMYDWSTLQVTSSPEYYKWTQWLFLQLYKHGLAYRKQAPVWWCPGCQTVLANEQVIDGACERCGSQVEKRELKQWFFKITDFAEDLLSFDGLTWPDRVKTLQTNWIGKSEGADIEFTVEGLDKAITVFTTRADTLMGVTYLVVAPEHPLLHAITTDEQRQRVNAYVQEAQRKTEIDRLAEDREKKGVFTGGYAVHPLSNERVPIWVADYVVGSYGTGAVMGVPAHDERDFAFAQNNDLPIQFVIRPTSGELDETRAFVDYGTLFHSGQFGGLTSRAAQKAIVAELEQRGRGKLVTRFRLRDWLVSRQRYWGAPIPIIYCEQCGEQPVPKNDLPVLLPTDVAFTPQGGSPLERHPSFRHVACPKCGNSATRETDTLDTFVDSSWYYLRFTDPRNREKPFGFEQVKQWMPVDFYVGGTEHAILHLLYSRFIMKALHKLGLVPYDEPFKEFFGNGMIYLHGKKMSKSKGNVVNPDEMVKKFGTDSLRGYMLFMGPADQDVEWQANGITGVRRFLDRVWQQLHAQTNEPGDIALPLQKAAAALTQLLNEHQFNRAISTLMIASNSVEDRRLNVSEAELLCRLMAPFFPHFAEEVWQYLGHTVSVFSEPWPEVTVVEENEITLPVQVNGKLRLTLTVDRNTAEADVVGQALAALEAKGLIAPQDVKEHVFVPGRIVNFVVK